MEILCYNREVDIYWVPVAERCLHLSTVPVDLAFSETLSPPKWAVYENMQLTRNQVQRLISLGHFPEASLGLKEKKCYDKLKKVKKKKNLGEGKTSEKNKSRPEWSPQNI